MKPRLLSTLLLIGLLSAVNFAQVKTNKFSATVKISVEHDSDRVETEVNGYIEKAVRELNDVDTEMKIADKYTQKWDYEIDVILADSTVDGKKLGYAIAVIIGRNSKCVDADMQEPKKPQVLTDCVVIEIERVSLIPLDGLDKEAAAIMVNFKKVFGLSKVMFNLKQITKNP